MYPNVVLLLTEKPCYLAHADIPKKRRLPSSYAHRRKKLPSAFGMNLTIMRQQQGVMTYDEVTKQPCYLAVDSPLYMNYTCNVYQVRQATIIVCKLLSSQLTHLGLIWKQVV